MESNSNTPSNTRIHFQHLRKNGYRFQVNPWLIIYWEINQVQKTRILWNLSRKVSHAVVRNKLKRWCREFIRVQLKDIVSQHGLDLNVVFKPQKKEFYKDLRREQMDNELLRFEKKLRSSLKSG